MGPDAADIVTSGKQAGRSAPLSAQHMTVGDGHEIYVETVGRADGIPAVYLHGGVSWTDDADMLERAAIRHGGITGWW